LRLRKNSQLSLAIWVFSGKNADNRGKPHLRRLNQKQEKQMKKLLLGLGATLAWVSLTFAGSETYSGKEVKQTVAPAPCPQWYADQEWDVSLWGTYAFTGTEAANDRYIESDHAWGGGIDAKYFFHRYFGLGIEGYVLDARSTNHEDVTGFTVDNENRRAIGSVLGTLTLRYPIPCTRFAPYIFGGGGAIFGGGRTEQITFDANTDSFRADVQDAHTEAIGQFGGGFEIRITPRIGWINDFSWNVVNGPENNFGMVRSGINFAF